jgi:hypothetical protein
LRVGDAATRERLSPMATIIPFLNQNVSVGDVFDQKDITAMSMALDDVCRAIQLQENNPKRDIIAERIIALARRGERSPTRLRDRILHEAGFAEYAGIRGPRTLKSRAPMSQPAK